MKETHRLVNLTISKIATVDFPDNPPARIVLFKRRKMAKDNVTAEDIAKLPENVQKLLKDLTKKAEQNDTQVKDAEEATGILAGIKKLFKGESDKPEVDDVLKDADPAIKEALAKASKETAEAKAETAKLRDRLDRDEMFRVAKDLPGKADDTVSQLVKIKQALGDEEFTKYVTAQKALKAQSASLFGEVGAGDAGASKGEDAITAIAKTMRAADPKLTKEAAYLKAMDSDEGRAAYKEHDDERRDH